MSRRAVVQIVSNSNFFSPSSSFFFHSLVVVVSTKSNKKYVRRKSSFIFFPAFTRQGNAKSVRKLFFTRNNSNQLIMFLKDFPLFLLSLSFSTSCSAINFPTHQTHPHKLFTLFALNLFLGWVYGTENNSVWSWTRLPALWKNCHICEKLLLLLREIIFALWIFSMCISLKHSKDIHMIILLTMMKTIMWKAE